MRPPRIAESLLERLLPTADSGEIIGDLQEELETEVAGRHGRALAAVWYWRSAMGIVMSYYFESLKNCVRWTRGWGRDLTGAVRGLAKQPVFSLVIIATLALGIGANTLVFSFVDALLIDPLPFRESERLVRIEALKGGESARLSVVEIREIAERSDLFESVGSYRPGAQYVFGEGGSPVEVPATLATGDLFDTLAVAPSRGTVWPERYDRERSHEVMLSHDFWQRGFGGDPAVIGRKISLDNVPGYTIHGVLPPGFDFPQRSDIYRSIAITNNWVEDPSLRLVFGVGRLAPGVSLEQAQSALDGLAAQLETVRPEVNRGIGFRLTSLEQVYVGDARPYVLLLFCAVGLVLLIVCANLANLLLSRAAQRQRETAVRVALGADRILIARRFLTESLLLSLLGGLLGLAGAFALLEPVRDLALADMPSWIEARPNWRIALFSMGAAVLAALSTGVAPAVVAAGERGLQALRISTRTTVGGGQQLLRKSLVVAQIALALTVIAGACLTVRGFDRLRQADLGFTPDHLLTYQMALTWSTWNSRNADQFFVPLLEKLNALPGVESAAFTSNLPLSPTVETRRMAFEVQGRSVEDEIRDPLADLQYVSPGYFETMGLRLARGRVFEDRDGPDATPVAIVSQSFADALWPGEEPLRRRVRVGYDGWESPWLEVVGVVDDVRHRDVAGPTGMGIYVPFRQVGSPNGYLVLRTSQDPLSLADAATRVVWDVDPTQATFDVTTMQERVDARLWRQRLSSSIFASFGILAMVLASVGLYGVMAYFVASRTRESGIRMALGAKRADALRLVLGEALRLTALGLAAGALLSFAAQRMAPESLIDVQPSDWPLLLGAPALLCCIALLASAMPALRASRVDPMISLRAD